MSDADQRRASLDRQHAHTRPALTGPCPDPRRHDSTELCPLHGCPDCLRAYFEHSPPEDVDVPPFVELDAAGLAVDETAAFLNELHVTPRDGCEICGEIQLQAYRRAYPGAACELRDCLHCEAPGCDVCMDSGRVCRTCQMCDEHAEDDGPCGLSRWSPVLRREVWFAVHETYDKTTGRWSA